MKTLTMSAMSVLMIGLSGCINISDWRTVSGSGQVISEARQVANFDQVSLGGSGALTLVQGDVEALTIEADDNLMPLIITEVVGGELRIGPRNVNLRPSKTIKYQLQVKNLNALHLSGSLHAETSPLKTETLSLHISGSGDIKIAKLDARDLETHISGSGTISASGQVNRQNINISGAGSHHAADLKSNEATVHVSGSGHTALWVSKGLSVHISGSGQVEYFGHPTVNNSISGSGRVKSLGDK